MSFLDYFKTQPPSDAWTLTDVNRALEAYAKFDDRAARKLRGHSAEKVRLVLKNVFSLSIEPSVDEFITELQRLEARRAEREERNRERFDNIRTALPCKLVISDGYPMIVGVDCQTSEEAAVQLVTNGALKLKKVVVWVEA